MEFQLSYSKSWKMMLWKCCTQYASKFGKLSSGHRTRKCQFSFQSQRRAMPKNAQTTTQLHSSHTLVTEKAMAPHSSTFTWRIPWMEEPGRLQSMGSLESDMTEWLHFHFSRWTFFGIALLWDLNENWPFLVLWPLLSFPNLLTYWVQHFHSIIF